MTEKTQTRRLEGKARLKEIVKQRFTPEGKEERVAKARAALYQVQPIKLSPEEWKWVAEGADIEDQA